jgi:hypothetical protein
MPCDSRNVRVGSALPARLGAEGGAVGRHLGSVSEAPPIDNAEQVYPIKAWRRRWVTYMPASSGSL